MASNRRPIGTTRLEQLRRHYARTQAQLAADAGVPRHTIVMLEGGYLPPRSGAAERLARHLGCTVPELVERNALPTNRALARADPGGRAREGVSG